MFVVPFVWGLLFSVIRFSFSWKFSIFNFAVDAVACSQYMPLTVNRNHNATSVKFVWRRCFANRGPKYDMIENEQIKIKRNATYLPSRKKWISSITNDGTDERKRETSGQFISNKRQQPLGFCSSLWFESIFFFPLVRFVHSNISAVPIFGFTCLLSYSWSKRW